MSDSISRAFVSDIEVRADGTGRTVHGIVVPFGQVARVSDGGPSYDEMFEPGSFKRTITMRPVERVKLLSQHNSRNNPLGRASMLREETPGLYGEFHVSKTAAGDEALELLRDGALDSFSVGFSPIKHRMDGRTKVRTEVGLREASLVTFPAYDGALIGGVRALADLDDEERDEWLRMVGEHFNLRPTTPAGDAEADRSTSDEPAPADDPADGHSPAHLKEFNHSRARARREGGPLS